MEFQFNVNEYLRRPIVVIRNTLLPADFNGDRRALWNTVNRIAEIVNEMGEASAHAQGLNKPITTAERLRQTDQSIYFLVDQNGNNGNGAVTGMLKVGKKGLYVFDREGQQYQVTPPCILDFYVHEKRQRCGLGKQLFQHMLQEENIQPHHLAIDKPSEKFLNFLKKHYKLENPVKQMNNYVVYDGFFPKSEKDEQSQKSPLNRANGLQERIQPNHNINDLSLSHLCSDDHRYGRYGAPRPPCSMGQIIHHTSSQKNSEPTSYYQENNQDLNHKNLIESSQNYTENERNFQHQQQESVRMFPEKEVPSNQNQNYWQTQTQPQQIYSMTQQEIPQNQQYQEQVYHHPNKPIIAEQYFGNISQQENLQTPIIGQQMGQNNIPQQSNFDAIPQNNFISPQNPQNFQTIPHSQHQVSYPVEHLQNWMPPQNPQNMTQQITPLQQKNQTYQTYTPQQISSQFYEKPPEFSRQIHQQSIPPYFQYGSVPHQDSHLISQNAQMNSTPPPLQMTVQQTYSPNDQQNGGSFPQNSNQEYLCAQSKPMHSKSIDNKGHQDRKHELQSETVSSLLQVDPKYFKSEPIHLRQPNLVISSKTPRRKTDESVASLLRAEEEVFVNGQLREKYRTVSRQENVSHNVNPQHQKYCPCSELMKTRGFRNSSMEFQPKLLGQEQQRQNQKYEQQQPQFMVQGVQYVPQQTPQEVYEQNRTQSQTKYEVPPVEDHREREASPKQQRFVSYIPQEQNYSSQYENQQQSTATVYQAQEVPPNGIQEQQMHQSQNLQPTSPNFQYQTPPPQIQPQIVHQDESMNYPREEKMAAPASVEPFVEQVQTEMEKKDDEMLKSSGDQNQNSTRQSSFISNNFNQHPEGISSADGHKREISRQYGLNDVDVRKNKEKSKLSVKQSTNVSEHDSLEFGYPPQVKKRPPPRNILTLRGR